MFTNDWEQRGTVRNNLAGGPLTTINYTLQRKMCESDSTGNKTYRKSCLGPSNLLRIVNRSNSSKSPFLLRFLMIGCTVPSLLMHFYLCITFSLPTVLGIAVLFPFLPVAFTQKGLSPSEAGQIYGVIPFLSAIIRIFIGALADRLQAHRSLLMMFCPTTGGILFCLIFVPGVPLVSCIDTLAPIPAELYQEDKQDRVNLHIFSSKRTEPYTPVSVNCSAMMLCGEITMAVNSSMWVRTPPHSDCGTNLGKNYQLRCLHEISRSHLDFSHRCKDVAFNFKIDFDCSMTVEKQCFQERKKYDKTFWIILTVSLLGYFAFSPTTPLMHAITYALLDENRNQWGKQRYFGTLGFLTAALAIGLSMQLTSEGTQSNLTANCVTYLILCTITALFVYLYKIPSDIKCESLLQNIKFLIRNPVIDALFALVFFLGFIMGSLETFQLLYVKELGGSELLLGLYLFVNCILEVAALYFADIYLGKLGYVHCLYISCAAHALRFLSLGFFYNPWLVLLINCLHSITFGFMYTAAGAHGSANTPPAMHGTIQGVIQALHFGFGRGLGGMVSGHIVEQYGMRKMFFILSGISIAILCLYFLVQCFLPKQTVSHTRTVTGKKLNKGNKLNQGKNVESMELATLNKSENDKDPDVTLV